MSLNIVFAGNIVDENLTAVSGAYIQAFYSKDDGITTLWDSSVRTSEANGDYSINFGDETFGTPNNSILTNGDDGSVIINVWTGENGRNGLLDSLASIVIPLSGTTVYLNNIQLKSVGPLSCENWVLDTQAFRNDVITATNTNTNERTYEYNTLTHYQNRVLENEVMFDSLGVKTEEYNFGTGYNSLNSFIFDTDGSKEVLHKVTDLYNPEAICTKNIDIFSRVLGGLDWLPSMPIVHELTEFTQSILFDVDRITNIEYLIEGVSVLSVNDYTTNFSHTPLDLPEETITQRITYFNGFNEVVYNMDFVLSKTNQAPIISLEAFKPIPGGTEWSFRHNGTDIDGTIDSVQWVIERNNKDLAGNDNWDVYHDTGVLTDINDFTYDFKDQWGEFKLICTIFDDYDLGTTDEHIFTYDPEVDLSNVDWRKTVRKTTFGVNTIKKTFSVKPTVIPWGVTTTRSVWKTTTQRALFDTKVNKVTFTVKTCNK